MKARSMVAACIAAGSLFACSSPGASSPVSGDPTPDASAPPSGATPGAGVPCPTAATAKAFAANNTYGTLHGTLLVPAGCGPFTTVVMVPGSGPTDRDGNNTAGVGANTYKLLAEALAAKNVASLRYDKAGIGESVTAGPKNEIDFRFELGANDVVTLVGALRKEPLVGHVVVAGHSEGSLLGMLASERTKADGYVSIAGAGRPIAAVLREQLVKGLSGAALTTANDILASLEKGQLVSTVPANLMALFRPSVQPYIISWMKYDPAVELRRVPGPALITHGTTDIQVDVSDAQLLAAARPDAKLVLVDGMNHVLKQATLDTASQNTAYQDPTLPIVPALVTALVSFAR